MVVKMRKSQVKQSTGLEAETKDLLTKNMNDEEEDTFCYKLIEEGVYDVNKLKRIIEYASTNKNIDKKALKWIINCVDRCYIYHKDEHDYYTIKNYSIEEENMWEGVLKERLLQALNE
jgi:hypothetical protein